MAKQKQVKKLSGYVNRNVCFKCGKPIHSKSNYLKLITMNEEKVVEELWFHLSCPNCWGDYNSERFNQRMNEMMANGLNAIKPMLAELNQNQYN